MEQLAWDVSNYVSDSTCKVKKDESETVAHFRSVLGWVECVITHELMPDS